MRRKYKVISSEDQDPLDESNHEDIQTRNQDQIKPKRSQTSGQSNRALSSTEFNGYKIHSAFRGKFKVELKSFSLLRWRTGRGDELVQVDPVCNTGGSSDESLHEILKVVLSGIGNLDGGQLLFSRLLAMNAD